MSDLESRERAIYDYIDRAISDSTRTRFDETNSRIDAIDYRLNIKLEEINKQTHGNHMPCQP